jgi:chaperonin cofactor prefoldin
VSLVGNWLHNRVYRAAVARELKKQLAPVNKKLDELEKQNEELKKQNEQLKKQLR